MKPADSLNSIRQKDNNEKEDAHRSFFDGA